MSHWQAAPDVALSRQQHKTLFQAQGRYLRRLGLIALAKVLDTWHWSGFFVVIAIAAGISALLLLPFLNAQTPREA